MKDKANLQVTYSKMYDLNIRSSLMNFYYWIVNTLNNRYLRVRTKYLYTQG